MICSQLVNVEIIFKILVFLDKKSAQLELNIFTKPSAKVPKKILILYSIQEIFFIFIYQPHTRKFIVECFYFSHFLYFRQNIDFSAHRGNFIRFSFLSSFSSSHTIPTLPYFRLSQEKLRKKSIDTHTNAKS